MAKRKTAKNPAPVPSPNGTPDGYSRTQPMSPSQARAALEPPEPSPLAVGDYVRSFNFPAVYRITAMDGCLATLSDGSKGVHISHLFPAPAPSEADSVPSKVDKAPSLRSVRWAWQQPGSPFGVLQITDASRKSAHYLAKMISRRFHCLTKLEPGRKTTYFITLPGKNPETHPASCGCDGFFRHGRCKHLEALLALRERGDLG